MCVNYVGRNGHLAIEPEFDAVGSFESLPGLGPVVTRRPHRRVEGLGEGVEGLVMERLHFACLASRVPFLRSTDLLYIVSIKRIIL